MISASDTAPLLIWLDGSPLGREQVGGKGSSLSQLAALGAPVPPAFALTTAAYARVAASLGLPRKASDVETRDLPAIRASLLGASISLPVARAIAEGFAAFQQRLGDDVALAVRSSATVEDGAGFSFAGLHDTLLDVRSLPALEAAVRQCWASLWSERALAYRRASGLAGDDAAIAVVVQQLAPSDVSFVAFTRDPVSGREDHVVISASWGLGEAVVSGLVTPDHIVVGPDGQVAEYGIGDKQVMIIPGAGPEDGPRDVPVPRGLRALPALSHEQATAIAALARDVASRLGYAADVEGAIAGDTIYLFQARPITTLPGQTAVELALAGRA